MKIYTIKCFDDVFYEQIILGSFTTEDIAECALDYYEKLEEQMKFGRSGFRIETNDIYETYEEFLESQED